MRPVAIVGVLVLLALAEATVFRSVPIPDGGVIDLTAVNELGVNATFRFLLKVESYTLSEPAVEAQVVATVLNVSTPFSQILVRHFTIKIGPNRIYRSTERTRAILFFCDFFACFSRLVLRIKVEPSMTHFLSDLFRNTQFP
jgi:hypothetical protein